jgi:NAD(P)-dependent dehydrogenase (short-subunit alcohol dehydrogenase family)
MTSAVSHGTRPCAADDCRAVLVTGCSSGIGRHIAGGLMERGYRVFATARKHDDVERLAAAGLESLQLDVANSSSIEHTLQVILERTGGRLYGLFNNAGYGQNGAVEDLDRDVLREQFETNLFGLHELTVRVIPVMRRQGEGRIIQNSSVMGLVTLKYRGAYSASKFALEGLTDALRMELRGSGVHVSLIEPGPVRSAFRKNAQAAFRKNINVQGSFHRADYARVTKRLEKEGDAAPFTLGPEAVLKKVIHALESGQPRARYYVTKPTYVFGFLKRILSTAQLDRMLLQVSDAENRD